VGIVGLSLGGQLAGLVATVTASLDLIAMVGPPDDLAQVLISTRLGSIYRAILEESGTSLDRVRHEVERVSRFLAPSSRCPLVRREDLFVVIGDHDLIVPPDMSARLASSWEIAAQHYPQGHMSLIFWEKRYLHEFAERLRG
ncbi:MAG: hypothetical protein AB1486_28895, partial [Planctomycetota bacterium]